MISANSFEYKVTLAFSHTLQRKVDVRVYYNPAKLSYDYVVFDRYTKQRLYAFSSVSNDIPSVIHDFENQHPEALI